MTLEESNLLLQGGLVLTTTAFNGNVAIFFDYLSEESNTVEASITDNWVENNYSRQDHIAVKPRVYRLRGYVGEVIFKQPSVWTKAISDWSSNHQVLKKTQEVVKPITAISGIVSNYTQAAINVVNQIESSFNRYKQIYDAFKNKNQEYIGRRQKVVSSILLNLLETKTPVKLTDLTFQDVDEIRGRGDRLYFLQSVSAKQGDNAFITDIEVTIKEFRIATSQITEVDTKKFAGELGFDKTKTSTNGGADTKEVTTPKETNKILNEETSKAAEEYLKNKTPKNYINYCVKFWKEVGYNEAQRYMQPAKTTWDITKKTVTESANAWGRWYNTGSFGY